MMVKRIGERDMVYGNCLHVNWWKPYYTVYISGYGLATDDEWLKQEDAVQQRIDIVRLNSL